jgi:hypothetical protein
MKAAVATGATKSNSYGMNNGTFVEIVVFQTRNNVLF